MSRRRIARRGAVYVAVLGTTLLVVSIGLGSLAVARSRMAASMQDSDGLRARELAAAGMEEALRRLAANTAWREAVGGDGIWIEDKPFLAGTLSVWLADPEDWDLADELTDPVEVGIRAEAGDAVRRLQAIVDLRPRAAVLEPRVMADGQIQIRDSVITGVGALRTNERVVAQDSEVHLDVAAGQGISGSAYHGLNRDGTSSISVPPFNTLAGPWAEGATVIDIRDLPFGGTPLAGWELGAEAGGGDWFVDSSCVAVASCGQSTEAAVEGGCVVDVLKRVHDWSGAYISIRDLLNSGVKPRMRVLVRLRDAADAPVNARLVLRYRYWHVWDWYYSDWFVKDGSARACGDDWVDLEVSASQMSWNPRLWQVSEAWIDVETPGSTAEHIIDDGRLYDSALDATAPLLLHRVRLGPQSNPFGTPNAAGRYVIDLAGRYLIIRDCVIEGTLVLRNAGDGTRIECAVAWQPMVPGYPIVIVGGRLTVAPDGHPVQEQAIGVDLDGDGARASTIPAALDGLIYAQGRLSVQGSPVLGGSLMTRNGVFFDGAAAHFTARRVDPSRVPAGFTADAVEAFVRPGTLSTLGSGGSS